MFNYRNFYVTFLFILESIQTMKHCNKFQSVVTFVPIYLAHATFPFGKSAIQPRNLRKALQS